MYYAQINQDSIAFAVTETAGEISQPDMIPLASFDTSVIGKKWSNGLWDELPPPTAQAAVVWTVLAFRSRFTEAEKRAIYSARTNSIDIQIWLDDLAAADEVRSDDPRMIAGVQGLEAAGLLTAGRASEIMGAA
jgi:hypothetical protein